MVLFRCDGSPELGLGHVVRSLALADQLHRAHGCRPVFAMRSGPLGFSMVEEQGYRVVKAPKGGPPLNYPRWMVDVTQSLGAAALVLDVRDDLSKDTLGELRGHGVLVVTIDDPSDRRLAADLAFYPPVPQVRRMDWTGFTGELYSGWKWVVLRSEFARRPAKMPCRRRMVLVTMGGSDPHGLTLRAVQALGGLDDKFDAVVVLGRGFCHHEALGRLISGARRPYQMRQDVEDMPGLMAKADLAIASFGVTAYELAAMGVPAIYLCLTPDHAEAASAFVEAGMAISLGLYTEVSEEAAGEAMALLLRDTGRRASMVHQAILRVDGRGAERVADAILSKMASIYG